MKIKSSILIWCSLLLGFVGIVLPGTKIQYQVLVNANQSNTKPQTVLTKEGYASVFGDKYGRDAFSCELASLESLPSKSFINLLSIWKLIGSMLIIGTVNATFIYYVRRKISLLKFFILVVVVFCVPISILVIFSPETKLCDFDDLYRVISFTPNWLSALVLIIAILLGYIANRYSPNDENSVGASTL